MVYSYSFWKLLEMLFHCVPELECDNVRICQSKAVERLVAKKLGNKLVNYLSVCVVHSKETVGFQVCTEPLIWSRP